MVHNLVRKGGVPVLAYSSSDPSIPWPCSLMIQQTESASQVTVSLQSSAPIHGFDDEQTFTLRFEGDNVVPGTMSLGPVDIPLRQEWFNKIARQGNPQLRTLSLILKAPCSVWYPHSLSSISSTHGLDTSCHQLVTLSRATSVHILFDRNWLGQDNQRRLQRLVSCSEKLTGVPVVENFTNLYKQADWSIFSSVEDAVAGAPPPIEDAACDAPPPYAYVSNKRSRQTRTSLTPESPSPKRVLLQDPACPPSPTERATSVLSPSAKSTVSSVTVAHGIHEAITNAVENILPDVLRTVLPDVLQKILPDILPRLLAVSQSSPSSSFSPSLPAYPTPNPKPVPSISTLLSAHVDAHLQKIFADAVEHAADIHNAAGAEFSEVLDEHKLDVGMIKDDAIAELSHECDEKLIEFKERAAEAVEEVEEHAEKVFSDVCDRLDSADVRNRCIGYKITQDRGRRSISLPP